MNTSLVVSCASKSLSRARQFLAAAALFGALASPALATDTSFKHQYIMRGQILEMTPSLVVCVGKEDGAQVGQVLDVVRHVRSQRHGKTSGSRFRREHVGTVEITALFDDHYATAAVVKGSPKLNDTVELARQ